MNAFLALGLILSLAFGSAVTEAQVTLPASGSRLHYRGKEIFLSGANLAWIHYAHDFGNQGPGDRQAFAAFFKDLRANGANCARIWVHTDGSGSPQFDAQGMVTGLGPDGRFLDDMQAVLDSAQAHGILVLFSIWSERMKNAHQDLVTDTARTRAYIDKALIPMVKRFQVHPALVAWEVLNEPEGMTQAWGWKDANVQVDNRIPVPQIQAFINRLAGAIRRNAPEKLITAGSWGFFGQTDIALTGEGATWWPGPNLNLYTNARLLAAGGDPAGYLDFYQVHFYDQSFPIILSPFHNPYAHWQLDKPLLIGEFPSFGLKYREPKMTSEQAFEAAYQGGYAGALTWQYNQADSSYTGWWGQARAGARALRDLHPRQIDPDSFAAPTVGLHKRGPGNLGCKAYGTGDEFRMDGRMLEERSKAHAP